jgi:hypothetical protein
MTLIVIEYIYSSFLCNFNLKLFSSDKYFASYIVHSGEAHVGLNLKCPLLYSDFKLNWNR